MGFMNLLRSFSLSRTTRKHVQFYTYRHSTAKSSLSVTKSLRTKDIDFASTQLALMLREVRCMYGNGCVGMLLHADNVCDAATVMMAAFQSNLIVVPIAVDSSESFEKALYATLKLIQLRLVVVDDWYAAKIKQSECIQRPRNDEERTFCEVFEMVEVLQIGRKRFKKKVPLEKLNKPYEIVRDEGNIALMQVDCVNGVINAISEVRLFEMCTAVNEQWQLQSSDTILSSFSCMTVLGICVNVLIPIMTNCSVGVLSEVMTDGETCETVNLCSVSRNVTANATNSEFSRKGPVVRPFCNEEKKFIQALNRLKPSWIAIKERHVVQWNRFFTKRFALPKHSQFKGIIVQKENYCWTAGVKLQETLTSRFNRTCQIAYFYAADKGNTALGIMIKAGMGLQNSPVLGNDVEVAINNSSFCITKTDMKQVAVGKMIWKGRAEEKFYIADTDSNQLLVRIKGRRGLWWKRFNADQMEETLRSTIDLYTFLRNEAEYISSPFYGIEMGQGKGGEGENEAFIISTSGHTLSLHNCCESLVKIPEQIIADFVLLTFPTVRSCRSLSIRMRNINLLLIVGEGGESNDECSQIISHVQQQFNVPPVCCLMCDADGLGRMRTGKVTEMFLNGKLPVTYFALNLTEHAPIRNSILNLKSQILQNYSHPMPLGNDQEIVQSFLARGLSALTSCISIMSLLPVVLTTTPSDTFMQWIRPCYNKSPSFFNSLFRKLTSRRYSAITTVSKHHLNHRIQKAFHLIERLKLDYRNEKILLISNKTGSFYTLLYAFMCMGFDIGIAPVDIFHKQQPQNVSLLREIYQKFKFTRIITCEHRVKTIVAASLLHAKYSSATLEKCSLEVLLWTDAVINGVAYRKCKNYFSSEYLNSIRSSPHDFHEGKAEAKFYQITFVSNEINVVSCCQSEIYDYCCLLVKNFPELTQQSSIVSLPGVDNGEGSTSMGYTGTLMLMDIFMGIYQGVPTRRLLQPAHSVYPSSFQMLMEYFQMIDAFQSKVIFIPTTLMRRVLPYVTVDYRRFSLKSIDRFLLLHSTKPTSTLLSKIQKAFLCNALNPNSLQLCFETASYAGGLVAISTASTMQADLQLNDDFLSFRRLASAAAVAEDKKRPPGYVPFQTLPCIGKLIDGLSTEVIAAQEERQSTLSKPAIGTFTFHTNRATYRSDVVGFLVKKAQWTHPYVYLLGTQKDTVRYRGKRICASEAEELIEDWFDGVCVEGAFLVRMFRKESRQVPTVRRENIELLAAIVEVASVHQAVSICAGLVMRFWMRYGEILDKVVFLQRGAVKRAFVLDEEQIVIGSGNGNVKLKSMEATKDNLREGIVRLYSNGKLSECYMDITIDRKE